MKRPRTTSEWTDSVWHGRHSLDDVPAEKQVAVQTLGMRKAERVFQVKAERCKAGEIRMRAK